MKVYDFDKTIYRGDATVDFMLFALRRHPRGLLAVPGALGHGLLYFLGLESKVAFKEAYFGFLKYVENIGTDLERFWDEREDRMAAFYLAQREPADVIVTASPEFLIGPMAARLGVERLIGSVVDEATGKYSGRPCSGREKVERFEAVYPGAVIHAFYSDSLRDAPLAQKAARAYHVKGERVVPWEAAAARFPGILAPYLKRDFFLFLLCGGMGTLTNFCLSLVLSNWLDPTLSYGLSYSVSLWVTYRLNAFLIFSENPGLAGFLRFVTAYLPNFLILITFVFLFLNVLGWPRVAVYALAALLGLPVTYLLVKYYAFKRKGD